MDFHLKKLNYQFDSKISWYDFFNISDCKKDSDCGSEKQICYTPPGKDTGTCKRNKINICINPILLYSEYNYSHVT